MHGYTNFEQSKDLYDKGYRHPRIGVLRVNSENVYSDFMGHKIQNWFPSFSLADLVTMQGAFWHHITTDPVLAIIQSYVDSALSESEMLVDKSNQRLKEAYKLSPRE
jgi:hypothetical protein